MKDKLGKILLIFLACIIVLGLGYVFSREFKKRQILILEKRSLEEKIINLQKEQEALKNEIQTKGKESILEEEARLNLGMIKTGEKLVIIVPLKEITSTEDFLKKKAWYQSLLTSLTKMWQNLTGKTSK
ncbi:MAG: septum formation initiator family protein [Candidatus Parcubacteria bacterium]|nr:septum formation initiator family protein [Candidatus Parcubacteria bacterium]